MAAFLLRCLGFLAFTAPVATAMLILWGEVAPVKLRPNLPNPAQLFGFLDTRFKEADATGPVDVLFLGSSKAYRGFDNRIWEARGIRCFNLGSTGQTPLQTELLLDRYLGRMRPRLVVMEVDPVPMMDEGVEASLDFLANGRVDAGAVRMAWRIGHLKTWNALVFGAWLQLTGRRNHTAEPARQGPDEYVRGGFVQHDPERFHSRRKMPRTPYTARPEQMAAFLRSLRQLDASGTPFVLVTAPVTDAFDRSWVGDDALWAMLAPGNVHLRMQDADAYADSVHFYDRGHLNQEGVELFNRALLDSLERRGILRAALTADRSRR